MKVLLIGGTGTISYDTTELCISRGYDVYLFNRGHRNIFHEENVHYLKGDINNVTAAKEILSGYHFDVVVDYLTYDLDTLKGRTDLFCDKTEQYIFISSATVFPPQDDVITETSKPGNDNWSYSRNKRSCEEFLRNGKFPFKFTIVRPYVTYGDRRIPFPIISKKSCWNLLYRITNDMPILMCDDGNQKITLTHTRDFAIGIAGLFCNEKAYGEDFNIVGNDVYTWNDVIRVVENSVGKKAKVVYVSSDILGKKISSLREELLFDKAGNHSFDNKKIKEVVPDFEPRIDLNAGLSHTIENLLNDETLHIPDETWNAMEDVLCKKYGDYEIKVDIRERWIYYNKENRIIVRVKRYVKKILGYAKK